MCDYWGTSTILSVPWFPSIMPHDRFFDILQYLHLVDSSLQKKKEEEGYDPLFKVHPFLDHLSAVFFSYYQPSWCVSVDEIMTGPRCRISFLQHLPKKPTKFGIKIFVNSEAKTGYVLTFQIYTGKINSTTYESKSKGVAHCVVMDLLDPYLGRGHWVFTDNCYLSPALFLDFLKSNTYATGTMRCDWIIFP